MRDLRYLNETISNELIRRNTFGVVGVTPVKLSDLLGEKNEEERYKQIDNFFGENNPNKFTYGRFKELFDLGAKTPFRVGFESRQKLDSFGQKYTIQTGSKKGSEGYDEYVETFFIYLYYEVFVKPILKKDALIESETYQIPKSIDDAINKAKKIINETTGDENKDLELGLVSLTRYLISMIYPEIDSKIDKEESRSEFIENFINNNINLFIDYPLSKKLRVTKPNNLRSIVDDIYVSVNESKDVKNRQIQNLSIFSKMIKDGKVNFDVKLIEDSYRRLFSESLEAKVNDIMDILCEGVTDDVYASLGMSWTKDTSWSEITKIIVAILSMTKLTSKTEKAALSISAKELKYTKLLDTAEKDGGIHFINNMAFYRAVKKTQSKKLSESDKILAEKYKDIGGVIRNLNDLMDRLSLRLKNFTSLDSLSWTKSILLDPKSTISGDAWECPKFGSLDDAHKNAMINIMNITEMQDIYGQNDAEEILASINDIFFNINSGIDTQEKWKRWKNAALYAAQNVSDYADIKIVDPSKQDIISKVIDVSTEIGKQIKKVWWDIPSEMISKTINAFQTGNYWSGIVGLGDDFKELANTILPQAAKNVASNAFPETFKKESQIIDASTIYVDGKEIKLTPENYAKWMIFLSHSMGSMLCHGKVIFAPSGDSIYNSLQEMNSLLEAYDNALSTMIVKLKRELNADDKFYTSEKYDLKYRVTPFAVEFLKYALRNYINNIHKNTPLEKAIEEANSKDNLSPTEWSALVDELEEYIVEKLVKHSKTSGFVKYYGKSEGASAKKDSELSTSSKDKKSTASDSFDSSTHSISSTSQSTPVKVLKSSKKEQMKVIPVGKIRIRKSERKTAKEWIEDKGMSNFINLSYFESNGDPVGKLFIGGQDVGKQKPESEDWPLFCLSPYVGKERKNIKPMTAFSGKQVIVDSGFAKKFKKDKVVPRTCVGVDSSNNIVVYTSTGATLTDCAKKMKDSGCTFAVNVDGGSSTMFVEDKKILLGGKGKVPVILMWFK